MRSVLLGAVVAALLIDGSDAVLAHALLDRAEPRVGSTVAASPREVTLSFTENIEPALSTIEVIDTSGQRVDDGTPRISGKIMRVMLRPLPPGSYRVQWRVLSVDTHATEGSFSFEVRQ